ncbi:MAG TPA: hypothetical protein PKW15_00105 [Alphaproteobacteria bacterium]|nr:hypothetical protein [Rhodospirillaceae bacterium]HRJ11626.1 hypothetical protein [Alphaproteobacteria bacterium]
MTSLLIIAVMITVLLGATAYALLNASAGLSSQIDRATTETRLEEAARGVLANIVTIPSASSNYYAVPAPDSTTTSNIPSWIMANAYNSKAIPFLYCPYTNKTISGDIATTTITVPSGTYTVAITTLYTGSKNYLRESAARPANASSALAIIVAPGENATAAGDCTTISTTGTIAGNNVRVITEADVLARDSVMASRGEQLYVGTAASGDGSGRSTNNRAAFDVAMTYVNQYRPQYTRLDLAAGTYTTTEAVFSQTFVATRPRVGTRNSAIDFRGAGYNSSIITTGTTFNAAFASTLYLNGVGFENTTTNYIGMTIDRNNRLITDGAQLHRATIYSSGNAYFMGTTYFLGGTNGTIYNYAGSVYVGSTHNLASGTNFSSGYYWSEGGTLVYGAGSNLVTNSSNGGGGCGYYTYGPTRYIYVDNTITGYTGSAMSIGCMYPMAMYVFSGTTVTDFNATLLSNAYIGIWDRGTTWSSLNNPNTAIPNGHGAQLYITNTNIGSAVTTAARPSTHAVQTQSSGVTYGLGAAMLGGGTNGGWTVSNLSVNPTWNSTCWSGSDSYFATIDAGIRDGSYSKAVGASGFEPWLIVNRSNWYCYN